MIFPAMKWSIKNTGSEPDYLGWNPNSATS